MAKLTGDSVFRETAERWSRYQESSLKRSRALVYKSVFKLCYY
jgi:hypothetical protein